MPVGSFALALVCVTWSVADVRPQYQKASGGKVVITENTDKKEIQVGEWVTKYIN